MRARNTHQLNNRLLAACEQVPRLTAVTSLEDLIGEERPVKQQRNHLLPVRYGKKEATQTTVATVPTNTSIIIPTSTSMQVGAQPRQTLPNKTPTIENGHVPRTATRVIQATNESRPHERPLQQYRSVSPCRSISPQHTNVVRLHSPGPAQVIEIKYSSPVVVKAQQPLQQQPTQRIVPFPQPKLVTVSQDLPQKIRISVPKQIQEPSHQQVQPTPVTHQTNQQAPDPSHIRTSSLKILELNLKDQKAPSQKNVGASSSKEQTLPEAKVPNPFVVAPIKNKNIFHQPTKEPYSPFEASPKCESVTPPTIEKSSINHLNSIYSGEFLKRNDYTIEKPATPKAKPPKPVKRSSVAVGTSLHFDQIQVLEDKCRNYERQIQILHETQEALLREKQQAEHHSRQKNYNYQPSYYTEKHIVEPASTGTNSTSTMRSPFELEHLLKEQSPEEESEDSLYLREMRLERILRKYRSQEDIFELGSIY